MTRHPCAANTVAEWSVQAGVERADPYAEIDLHALVRDPHGRERRVPAFWRGGDRWSFRYASPLPGVHIYRTRCSDASDTGLHDRQGEIEVVPYEGDNPLYRHGPLRDSAGHPCLEHADGTPFPWLGDTWWMGLTKRLTWPDDFRWLTTDRVRKGFTLIQIVAGLYPDQPPFDPRGENEAGHPWTRAGEDGYELGTPNPAWWDRADERIAHLVSSGLVPCLVGCWGYYLELCGEASIRHHWDYLIARYGALPVVWCLAGEATGRYYTTGADWDQARAEAAEDELRAGWTRLLHHVREGDPFERPLTIHPTFYGDRMVDEPDLLDVNMLQTGHFGFHTLSTNADMIEEAVAREPRRPVVMSEACYEGIRATCFADVQRFMYWSSILSGAYGFTYGANGLWQVITRDDPYGASPHGQSWGRVTWQEAAELPGSTQVGLAARFLARYRWWELQPLPELLAYHQGPGNRIAPYAACIPGQVHLVFLPALAGSLMFDVARQRERDRAADPVDRRDPAMLAQAEAAYGGRVRMTGLEAGRAYHAYFFDPVTGEEVEIGEVTADAHGVWQSPDPPIFQDWVLARRAPQCPRRTAPALAQPLLWPGPHRCSMRSGLIRVTPAPFGAG